PARTGESVEYVEDLDVAGVPCRLYRPGLGRGVVIHLHGGGFVEGGLASHDAVCHRLAALSGWSVLALDYRLAPEHPFPSALEDAEAVIDYVQDKGGDLGVDGYRMTLLGDSAGGNFVAALTLRERNRRGSEPGRFLLQVMIYPGLGSGEVTPSREQLSEGFALTTDAMGWYADTYVPNQDDRSREDVWPALAQSLEDLPPALVITAELDPLRDEAERYAARLAQDRVPIVCTRYLGMVHGFWRRPATVEAAKSAVGQVAQALRDLPL
ncbi:MAG: alpha/beta hydrolase, partial [Haloechinothrix sp.]